MRKLLRVVFWGLILYAFIAFLPTAKLGMWELSYMKSQTQWHITKILNALEGRR